MGRPREHDEGTRALLRREAERLVAERGPEALTVRAVADAAGTSTRAIYALFGSKEGLVATLAEQAFRHLGEGLDALPVTEDPQADVIEAGAGMYRSFVREHPSLFRIAFQRVFPELELGPELLATRARSWERLEARFRRLDEAGLLGGVGVTEAAVTFNALCEGLGNAELRGGTLRAVPAGQEGRVWREAFETLVKGFAATGERP